MTFGTIPRRDDRLLRRSGYSPARRRTENWKLRLRALLGDTRGFGTRRGRTCVQSSDHGTAALSAGVALSRGLARLSTDDASLCTTRTQTRRSRNEEWNGRSGFMTDKTRSEHNESAFGRIATTSPSRTA